VDFHHRSQKSTDLKPPICHVGFNVFLVPEISSTATDCVVRFVPVPTVDGERGAPFRLIALPLLLSSLSQLAVISISTLFTMSNPPPLPSSVVGGSSSTAAAAATAVGAAAAVGATGDDANGIAALAALPPIRVPMVPNPSAASGATPITVDEEDDDDDDDDLGAPAFSPGHEAIGAGHRPPAPKKKRSRGSAAVADPNAIIRKGASTKLLPLPRPSLRVESSSPPRKDSSYLPSSSSTSRTAISPRRSLKPRRRRSCEQGVGTEGGEVVY